MKNGKNLHSQQQRKRKENWSELTRHQCLSRSIGDRMISSGMSSKNFSPRFTDLSANFGDAQEHFGCKMFASSTLIVHYNKRRRELERISILPAICTIKGNLHHKKK